jgi:hypothetical protein
MPPRKYSSAAGTGTDADEIMSTEGITFELDDATFECHGQIDGQDMIDLAVPMSDAGEGWFDPEALAAIGRFYRQVLGDETYRQFSAHRRRKRTPPSVVAQIMLDLIGEITSRPPARPSPSPAGPPTTPASSAAVSPSPERAVHMLPKQASDPEGIIPPEMAAAAEVVLAAPPEPGQEQPDPMAGMARVVNIGDPGRTRVEPSVN